MAFVELQFSHKIYQGTTHVSYYAFNDIYHLNWPETCALEYAQQGTLLQTEICMCILRLTVNMPNFVFFE